MAAAAEKDKALKAEYEEWKTQTKKYYANIVSRYFGNNLDYITDGPTMMHIAAYQAAIQAFDDYDGLVYVLHHPIDGRYIDEIDTTDHVGDNIYKILIEKEKYVPNFKIKELLRHLFDHNPYEQNQTTTLEDNQRIVYQLWHNLPDNADVDLAKAILYYFDPEIRVNVLMNLMENNREELYEEYDDLTIRIRALLPKFYSLTPTNQILSIKDKNVVSFDEFDDFVIKVLRYARLEHNLEVLDRETQAVKNPRLPTNAAMRMAYERHRDKRVEQEVKNRLDKLMIIFDDVFALNADELKISQDFSSTIDDLHIFIKTNYSLIDATEYNTDFDNREYFYDINANTVVTFNEYSAYVRSLLTGKDDIEYYD